MADMKHLLKTVWFTPGPKGRWGLPIVFEGQPGTAKTSITEEAAKSVGLHLETIIASLREPADFNGLPIPMDAPSSAKVVDAERRLRLYNAPAAWAGALLDAKRGVAFFDEINTAPPSVQAALLRVILDGWVGDMHLPPTVRFCAAMNPTEEAAGGWDLAAPLANRLGHWSWDPPDAESWSDWLLSAGGSGNEETVGIDPEKEEKRVLAEFGTPFAKSRGLVAGFIRARGELLLKMPKAGDPAASKAWPSPRTWELAARAIAGAEVHDLPEVMAEQLVSSFVGTGPASELATYKRKADLPDPADVLDGKVKFEHSAKRLDRTVAVLNGCAALITNPKADKRDARAAALWKLFGTIIGDAADVVVPSARVLVRNKLQGYPEARAVLLKIQPMLQAAGING